MQLNPKFLDNMQALLGNDMDLFVRSFEEAPVKALRINTLKIDIQTAKETMAFLEKQVPWCETGFYHSLDKIGKNPYYIAGLLYSQDASAMAPAKALDAKPGEKVLDLCAAPGGKTTQIAAMMQGKGILVSNEIVSSRAKILYENVERMGISNSVITNENPQKLERPFEAYFDKILVDAPCSGEGMFRKDPVALREWNENSNASCAARQRQILASAAHMLRAGGIMVYSTCTFSPQENEMIMEQFLKDFPSFELMDIVNMQLSNGFAPMEKTKRIWPHIQKGEGHFIAKLRKKDGFVNEITPLMEANEKQLQIYKEFEKRCLMNVQGNYYIHGETVHMFSGDLPQMQGVRVYHAGVNLGKMQKGRFEPHHQLARCLRKNQFQNVFAVDEETLKKYIKGETFDASLQGWGGVFFENWGIGLCKGANGILKNHYPKALRQ